MFDTSLQKLGVDYVDFYLIHNLGGVRTKIFDDYDMWNFVQELKEKGKVKHIGFSIHDTADELEKILIAHPEMEFVQLQINYADWENKEVQARKCYEVAQRYNKPVIIMEPLHGGTLANPPQQVSDVLKEQNEHISNVEWALRFCWDLPNVITVLSGMSTLEQMTQNISYYQAYKPLSQEERQALTLAQEKLSELIVVPCTACRYCVKVCPQNIPIDAIMNELNGHVMHGLAYAKNEYSYTVKGRSKASDCLKCGACQDACPQKIAIIEQLENAVNLFE